jgi:hypothetical protein
MISKFVIISSIIFLLSCSSKEQPYKWQANCASAFAAFSQSFLKDDRIGSQSELDLALTSAKSSANLEQLGSIYLGSCALNKAVGIKDNCSRYQKIAHLINVASLHAYYQLLNNQSPQIDALPSQYQGFAKAIIRGNYPQAFEAIIDIKKPTSQLIAAALIKEHLSNAQRVQILNIASQYGYKKAVIFWLKEHAKYSHAKQKTIILEKINVLIK